MHDLTLLMARVRAYVDLAKHTVDLKSVNDAFVRTMDELKSIISESGQFIPSKNKSIFLNLIDLEVLQAILVVCSDSLALSAPIPFFHP